MGRRPTTTQEEHRAASLEKHGDNYATEAKAIEEVSKILEKFELELVRDCDSRLYGSIMLV